MAFRLPRHSTAAACPPSLTTPTTRKKCRCWCLADSAKRACRSLHQRFERVPFYVAAKEISLEDIRLTLDKMPDRFLEHPELVLALTNVDPVRPVEIDASHVAM